MTQEPVIKGWTIGRVNQSGEHFFLRFGSADDASWSNWLDIALVGPPVGGIVPIEFIGKKDDPRYEAAVHDAIKDVEFYFLELNEESPWGYAQYHCGQLANVYSTTHWSFQGAKKPAVTPKKRAPRKRGA